MKKLVLLVLSFCMALGSSAHSLLPEQQLKDSLLLMLARFTTYVKADFQPCAEPNDAGEACGCFRSGSTMMSNEDGVRTNADLGMVCAFLCRYGRDKVQLPDGVTWADLEKMSMESLVFAYSTHRAVRLKKCADGRYWGSSSARERVWESSLWAMSVAYSAFFLWDCLTPAQQDCVSQLLHAECNYELERSIPTGFMGDTKAEENGWEACVLAATLGLFPHDELAPRWLSRLREFAVNSYSVTADSADTTVIDPDYDQVRVCDLYRGANLYEDYTLQNHNYFHTSYQNVVIQELGEAALALQLFQQRGGTVRWSTHALTHNCQPVMDRVLKWLALSDGELAMPNGNDWSLFLYDQLTSYSTMACLLHDADALMLENLAYDQIRRRQLTTPDGSWLLRSDIGARRMGVEAHRVMMTWLMHELWPTDGLQPSSWEDFRRRHSQALLLPCQQVVRASTAERFSCFSWSEGLKSYTGYVAPHCSTENNLVVPYKANNTGNLLGWYVVEGKRTNAVPAAEPAFRVENEGWTASGHLLCNDSSLDRRFTIFSTPGNAVVCLEEVVALADVSISQTCCGMLAVSEDAMTRSSRRFQFRPGYVNIDDAFSVVSLPEGQMQVGAAFNNNSVLTVLLSASHADSLRRYRQGETVDRRCTVYYSNVNLKETELLAHRILQLDVPAGWGGAIVPDTDGMVYFLLSNFSGPPQVAVNGRGVYSLQQGEALMTVWQEPRRR